MLLADYVTENSVVQCLYSVSVRRKAKK